MNYETKIILKEQMKELALLMVKNRITKSDILDLCSDPDFQDARDIIGRRLNYFEWRVHPSYPFIECSTEGDIKINGEIRVPKNYNGYKTIKYVRGKKTYDIDVAMAVLSAFKQMPDDGVYTVGFRDENPDNVRIQNLYWKLQAR